MISTISLGYTILLSEVVNPLLATQLPLNTLSYTQSSPYEQPILRQQGSKSKYRISIQYTIKHLKSKDTCIIAMIRLPLMFEYIIHMIVS